MLSGAGFNDVINLSGGIKAWNGEKAVGPQELNLDLIRGDESPTEMVVFAYGLETGLQRFYADMGNQSDDMELKGLFEKLAGVEENHKKTLFNLHQAMDPSGKNLAEFESAVTSKVMEGGFDIKTFMDQNAAYLHAVPDVIDLAMMLETQGLDLYLRFAEKSTDPQTKEALFKLADEEKAHLSALGGLREETNH